jgi:hypothetical protein
LQGSRKISKAGRWLIVVAVLGGAWAYSGFPSPDALLELFSAKQDCVAFAQKHKSKLFFGSGDKPIKALSSWLKNGRVVVEIAEFNSDDDTYVPRLCVIGGGTIQIVSVLENAAWR